MTISYISDGSIMSITYPIFTFQYYKESKKEKIFKKPHKFIIYILILIVFITITLLKLNFLGYFYYYLVGSSVLFTFYFINLVMVLLIPLFSQRASRLTSKYLILPSIIAIVLSLLELFVSFWFHKFIILF